MGDTGLVDQAMRLRMVRRVKNLLLLIIAILMIVLIIVAMVHKGMSGSPLFLPFPAILFAVIMCGMLMNLVSVIFNGVEIATSDTPGQRFLTAQHGHRLARITGVLVLVLVIVFILLIPLVDVYISTDDKGTLDISLIRDHEWTTVDDFDASYAQELTIKAVSGADLEYTLETKDQNTGDWEETLTEVVPSGETFTIDLEDWPREDYRSVWAMVEDPTDPETRYEYNIHRKLNPELKISLTGFLGAIAVANIVWAVITFILMKRYETESVGGLATSVYLEEM